MLGPLGDGVRYNHRIVLPWIEPPSPGTWLPRTQLGYGPALAWGPLNIAQLRVKSREVRKAKLQMEVGLLRAIWEVKRATWKGIKT